MAERPTPDLAADLYARLAPRLEGEEQRRLLRDLLAHLAAGGAEAVRAEVRRRLRELLGEEP